MHGYDRFAVGRDEEEWVVIQCQGVPSFTCHFFLYTEDRSKNLKCTTETLDPFDS